MVGSLRVSGPELCITETKPESEIEDLRLGSPWPGLLEHARSYDLDKMHDIGHVPYACLLIQAADDFRKQHGHLPSNAAERTVGCQRGSAAGAVLRSCDPEIPPLPQAFKSAIQSKQRHVDGFPLDEENFKEALQHAHRVWAPAGISSDVR